MTLSPRYLSLEADRLHKRIMDWLELEQARSPFRVAEQEQRRSFERRGVRVELRLDRVDELEDGSRVVLERPDDLQLPLYGVTGFGDPDAAPTAAVAFAQIRADRVAFVGVARDAGILPGLPATRQPMLREATDNWPAVFEEWSDVLDRLAAEFAAGEAGVDPKNGLKTCRDIHCELAPMCRIRERVRGTGDDRDGEGGGGFESDAPAEGYGDC